MKKLLPLFLALTLLAGCTPKPAASYDPAATAEALNSSGCFSETLEPLEQEVFCALYGLDAATLTDGVVYASTGSTAEEFAVLVLKDKAAADAALEVLKQRLADQKEANVEYRPMDMPKLNAAIVNQQGNSVLLVIANDADAASKALEQG
ncbi:MAG: DUF4358 domain-containing protein [Oscillospiraceae bacterium]